MITIITGTPGMGKTALAVSMMMEEAKNRPLFVMGVNELKVPHEKVPPVDQWTELMPLPEDPTITRPVFTFPPNAIVVIDEAQTIYRPRATSTKVPDIVAAFETHRHTGIDFWLITQNASFLDVNIKRLCDRHVHLDVNLVGKKTLYEWTRAADVSSKVELAAASSRPYKPPKRAFSMYKSAELHTKTPRRIPWQVWGVGILLLVLALGAYWMVDRVGGRVEGAKEDVPIVDSSPGQKTAKAGSSVVSPVGAGMPAVANGFTVVQQTLPRVVDKPETAPMYDGLRQVSAVPRMAACIASATKCTCYTDQATIYPAKESVCRDFIANPPFDPYASQQPLVRQGGGAVAEKIVPADPIDVAEVPSNAFTVPDGQAGPNLMLTPDRVF